MLKALLIAVMVCATGCLSIHGYDHATMDQIEATILFEKRDYKMSMADMTSNKGLIEMTIRHDSEILRLEMWRQAEKAKKLPD